MIGVPDEEAGEIPKAFVVKSGEVDEAEVMEYVAGHVSPQKKIRLVEIHRRDPEVCVGEDPP